jgi:hypothetical protein
MITAHKICERFLRKFTNNRKFIENYGINIRRFMRYQEKFARIFLKFNLLIGL